MRRFRMWLEVSVVALLIGGLAARAGAERVELNGNGALAIVSDVRTFEAFVGDPSPERVRAANASALTADQLQRALDSLLDVECDTSPCASDQRELLSMSTSEALEWTRDLFSAEADPTASISCEVQHEGTQHCATCSGSGWVGKAGTMGMCLSAALLGSKIYSSESFCAVCSRD
jgi:hypothetical protein